MGWPCNAECTEAIWPSRVQVLAQAAVYALLILTGWRNQGKRNAPWPGPTGVYFCCLMHAPYGKMNPKTKNKTGGLLEHFYSMGERLFLSHLCTHTHHSQASLKHGLHAVITPSFTQPETQAQAHEPRLHRELGTLACSFPLAKLCQQRAMWLTGSLLLKSIDITITVTFVMNSLIRQSQGNTSQVHQTTHETK